MNRNLLESETFFNVTTVFTGRTDDTSLATNDIIAHSASLYRQHAVYITDPSYKTAQ